MSVLNRARQEAHMQYAILLQWNYVNASVEEIIYLQDEYMKKIFFAISKKLSEMRCELEEIKLVTAIQEQIQKILENVLSQSQILFLDNNSSKDNVNYNVLSEKSSLQLTTKAKNSVKLFESLSLQLSSLRKSLQVNLNKIPCKELSLDSTEVLQSLIDLEETLSHIVPDEPISLNISESSEEKEEMNGIDKIVHSLSFLRETMKKEFVILDAASEELSKTSDSAIQLSSHIAQNIDEIG